MIIKKMAVGIYAANCYILIDENSDEAIVLDPGGEGNKIYKLLNSMGKKCKYIVLTHGHMDHIGGVSQLKKLTSAQIIIHKADGEMIKNPAYNLSNSGYGDEISFEADKLVSDGDEIKFANNVLKVIHTPGHTKGGMCLLIDKYLFSGDTLFERSIGRTDLYGGDYDRIIKSIKNKLLILDSSTVVYPGHGGETTIEIEKAKNPFLR